MNAGCFKKLLYSLTNLHCSDQSRLNDSSNNASEVRFGHGQISSFVCFNRFGELATGLKI